MAARNMKEALRAAKDLGLHVEQKRRSGELKVTDPDDPSNFVTISNHRKDAPRHLLNMLKRVEERRALERLKKKADKQAVVPQASERVELVHGVIASRSEGERIMAKARESAVVHLTGINEPKVEPLVMYLPKQVTTSTGTRPLPVTTTPVAPAEEKPMETKQEPSRSVGWNPKLDAFIAEWFATHKWQRGAGAQLYAVVDHSHPEWLIHSGDGKKVQQGTFSYHAASVLARRGAGAPATVAVVDQPVLTARLQDAEHAIVLRDATIREFERQVEAARELNGQYIDRIGEQRAKLNRVEDAAKLGAQACGLVLALVKDGNVDALQTLIDLAKQ